MISVYSGSSFLYCSLVDKRGCAFIRCSSAASLYRTARHRRNYWLWPLVLADRPLLHGPRRALRSAASGVRLDFERVVPWRPHDPKFDCWRAARDLWRCHYTSKTEGSTKLSPELASWRLPSLAHRARVACPPLRQVLALFCRRDTCAIVTLSG